MKSIEIATAHNIVVTQELASVSQRMAAFIIDAMMIGLYAILMDFLFDARETVSFLAIGLVVLFYHLFWEIFNQGQSPGKRFLNLRVVSLQGIKPSAQDLLLRWVFRLIDITFSLGTVAILSMVTSPKGQRIGDLLGRTAVINLRASRSVDLKSLQQIMQYKEGILYPGIARYSDTDMLLVKQTLQRYQTDRNEANSQMVQTLTERICGDLGISPQPGQPVEFLKKALADYILLTR